MNQELVGGGITELHRHPVTHSIDDLHRLHDLESVRFVSSDYVATYRDDIIFVMAAGAVQITLPLARGGKRVTISKVSGGSNVTVVPTGADQLDFAASKLITALATPVTFKAVRGTGYFSV